MLRFIYYTQSWKLAQFSSSNTVLLRTHVFFNIIIYKQIRVSSKVSHLGSSQFSEKRSTNYSIIVS